MLILKVRTCWCCQVKKKRKTLLVLSLSEKYLEVETGIWVERKESWSVEETERSCVQLCGVEIRNSGLVEKIQVLEVLLRC